MPGLLDKLNTLVKSSVNSVLDDVPGRKPSVNPARLGKDIDQEVTALRKRIESALNEEDSMKAQIAAMQQEIDRADKQADAALQQGDEANARALVQQMQRQQQQAAMLQADLEQHRRATSDLIEHVNQLDAIVSDARSQQQSTTPPDQETQAPGAVLSNMLRDARERVENAISSPQEVTHIKVNVGDATPPPPAPPPADPAKVDADLAARRSRLSKPD